MQALPTSIITITDPYVKRAEENLVDYLLRLQAKKFLFEVYKVAGLEPLTKEGYQGWERSDQINFRGHFFGHYMSALALVYPAEKRENIKEQLLAEMKVAITGLEKAQAHYAENNPEGAGYISAFREAALDEVEGKELSAEEKENVLVPWYNLHKILAGLLDVHQSLIGIDETISKKALTIASRFGDYIYNRMIRMDDPKKMLQIEYGGMNDALYHLFERTEKEEHLKAATYFDEVSLFEKLKNKENILPGHHANTMIPKFIGALKRYRVFQKQSLRTYLSEEEVADLSVYLEAAVNFWDFVTTHHTYCTGGHSQSEHFHEPDTLYYDAEFRVGDCTCETCNTHNMLKLSRELYFIRGEKKYLDYYERTYINSILASQNPEDGMMMYFQPMGAGYNKVYNHPFDEFWCCTGTGVESFATLADTYYFTRDKHIFVNLYFSNQVQLIEQNIQITQETDRKLGETIFTFDAIKDDLVKPVSLALRIPDWTDGYAIDYNGEKITDYQEKDSFIYLQGTFAKGDVIKIQFAPTLRLVSTSDNANYVAFEYGPYVLAGGLGKKDLDADQPNGIIVRVGTKDYLVPDALTVIEEDWRENIDKYMQAIDCEEKLIAFQLSGVHEEIIFSPYYEMHGERYGIYFKLHQADSKEAQQAIKQKKEYIRDQELMLDQLTSFDENNSEYAKNLRYEKSEAHTFMGRRYRIAKEKGWFAYEFSVHPEDDFYLTLDFHKSDQGKQVEVTLNDQETRVIEVEEKQTDEEFISQTIPLKQSLLTEDGEFSIKFTALTGETPKLFGVTFLKSLHYNRKVQLRELAVTSGEILAHDPEENTFALHVDEKGEVIFHLGNASHLVYVDDVLIDETQPRSIEPGIYTVVIFAQDHESNQTYTLKVTKSAAEK